MRLVRRAPIQLDLPVYLVELDHGIVAIRYRAGGPDSPSAPKLRRALITVDPDNRIRSVALHRIWRVLNRSEVSTGGPCMEMTAGTPSISICFGSLCLPRRCSARSPFNPHPVQKPNPL